MILPVPVTLNLFLALEFVFTFGICMRFKMIPCWRLCTGRTLRGPFGQYELRKAPRFGSANVGKNNENQGFCGRILDFRLQICDFLCRNPSNNIGSPRWANSSDVRTFQPINFLTQHSLNPNKKPPLSKAVCVLICILFLLFRRFGRNDHQHPLSFQLG